MKLEISFEQLVQLVKQLPKVELTKLKDAIDDLIISKKETDGLTDFQKFLLKGPLMSKKQIAIIKDNHKRINKWRRK
ncbi:MAG: hypothetical protein ABI723_11690 [Bacteroidia bacterium]